MPIPTGLKCEIEFVSGTWTNVTTDLDWNTGWVIRIGRTAPQDQVSPGSLTFTLRNPKGAYTPGAAVLSDGTTAPYYPNVTRRKRVRVSNSAGVRFLGYITSWSPVLVNGFAGYTQVVAADRLALLGRVTMAGDVQTEVLLDQPIAYWPLTDAAGSTTAVDASGVNNIPLGIQNGAGTALVFGDDGPGVEQGTGVRMHAGQTLGGSPLGTVGSTITLEAFVRLSLPATSCGVLSADTFTLEYSAAAGAVLFDDQTVIIGGPDIGDGNWHHIVGVVNGTSMSLYVDGQLASTGTTAATPSIGSIKVGDRNFASMGTLDGWVGHAAVYNAALSPARIMAHSTIVQQSQELVSDKVARFLTYAGLISAEWNIDTSTVPTGTYNQSGTTVLQACQDMATTEGGGSACYVLAGVVQFDNRSARKPASPTLTIDAVHDLDNSVYQPTLDDSTLVNKVTVSRTTESGGQSTQTAYDTTSINNEEITAQQVTTYAASDQEALNLAQSIVASGSTPGFRMPALAVDLTTAKTNLYTQIQATSIGSRIRVSNLPVGQAPATQVDVHVEGWTETANYRSYQIRFDTSPADAPPRMVWDDTTYGRWQAQPDCQLNAAITKTATSLVIKSPTAPTFTTTSARYPLLIQIDAEIIQLNTAPSGSSSPQTFSSVTRGMNGTTAAAHSAGAQVQLWPASTWTL